MRKIFPEGPKGKSFYGSSSQKKGHFHREHPNKMIGDGGLDGGGGEKEESVVFPLACPFRGQKKGVITCVWVGYWGPSEGRPFEGAYRLGLNSFNREC